MKKILSLFVVMSLFITGCGKDDDDKDYLEGTSWEAVDEYTDNGEWYKDVITLDFDKSTCKVTMVEYYIENDVEKSDRDVMQATYSYDPPKVTLTVIYEDGSRDTQILTVDGKKMTSTPDEDGEFLVFHKK